VTAAGMAASKRMAGLLAHGSPVVPLPSRTITSSGVSGRTLPAEAPRRSTVAGSAAIRALGLSRPFAFPLSLPARVAGQDHPRARIDEAGFQSIDRATGASFV
jgi:hypothetical protein